METKLAAEEINKARIFADENKRSPDGRVRIFPELMILYASLQTEALEKENKAIADRADEIDYQNKKLEIELIESRRQVESLQASLLDVARKSGEKISQLEQSNKALTEGIEKIYSDIKNIDVIDMTQAEASVFEACQSLLKKGEGVRGYEK